MIFSSIRARILAAALLPVGLVVVVLVGVFGFSRVGDMNDAHEQRSKLLVAQVAEASEYGLFSGNLVSLRSVSEAVLREPDVRAVTVFDANGVALVRVGASGFQNFGEIADPLRLRNRLAGGVDTLSQPIQLRAVELNDLFSPPTATQAAQGGVLGYAVVEVSRDSLRQRQRALVFYSILAGMAGLVFGGLLAVRLGSAVMHPIARVSRRIARIGQGDFSVEVQPKAADPLYELQQGLDQMASRLAWGREELEQRVVAATDALRVKKDEAEAATLAKSRFLAAASHDLRQPIHALGLFIARLGQLPMDGQAHQLVGSLEASVQAMQDLLDGLLDLSRLESGAVSVHTAPVSVGGMFDALRTALGPLAVAKGLRLRVRSSTLWARTDALVLQRIVMNLAHNAIRYTEHGTVLLACRSVDGGQNVRIEVWDSGIGISAEHQSQIFTEFYQVGNAARNRSQGLGLGLSIVDRSARLLGHPLSLRSNLGCGTRLSITMPAAAAPDIAMTPVAAPKPEIQGLEGVHVLVIEDDSLARDAIEALLMVWGCHVHAMQTVIQAQNAMHGGLMPDVIVSDYRLGNGDNGLHAIAALRTLAGRNIPACLMSGDTDGELMQAARQADLTLLHKPVRPAKLRALLRRLVMVSEASSTDTDLA